MSVSPERILRIRAAHQLTQAAFGLRLSVSAATVSRWERGVMRPRRRHSWSIQSTWPEDDRDERSHAE